MADTMAYQAEKTLRDNKDKIPADLNTDVEAKIAAVREALKGTDTAAIKSATQALNQSMQKIGEAIYKQQSEPTTYRNSYAIPAMPRQTESSSKRVCVIGSRHSLFMKKPKVKAGVSSTRA